MRTFQKTFVESVAIFAVGFAIIGSMLFAFAQNTASFAG